MDQYLSTVIIALITGVFSVITLVLQKKQDKVISKIDEQTLFIEKEKTLKQKLVKKEKERSSVIHDIMILILDTNLDILKNSQMDNNIKVDERIFETSDELKHQFNKLTTEIDEISREYDIVLEMTSQFKDAINNDK